MRKVIIVQARLASSRLPDKVTKDLSGQPVIGHIVDRLKRSTRADDVCIAIPNDASEDSLAATISDMGVCVTRGHGADVLGRFIQAAYETDAQVIVRAMGDNALVDPHNIDRQLDELLGNPELDYVTTDGLPYGVTVETFTLKTLEKLDYLVREEHLRKHVTQYLRRNPGPFMTSILQAPSELNRPELNFGINTPDELEFVRAIYSRLHKPGSIVDVAAAIELVDSDPAVRQLMAAEAAAVA
jgi:spore coat polysaccharide biosynthesis protein SpsF (cytidylyltransferase family)